ncbi:hypothetical protein [Saccharospirillum mangrovi]|uniref:hypothetical protein n=1 Tax=Saccharospirillum mangrovi TaxID=2161747 RepID=UPI000D370405|nr:hypothetical protein [Saccharospirillum mangrovi]
MTLHIRLLELERYLPNVNNDADLQRALGPLKRYCREQTNHALTLAPFSEADRGEAAVVIIGTDKGKIESAVRLLEEWMEATLPGQMLRFEGNWL